MIGFYDYTVILTYISLISSVFGMTRAIHGDYKLAIFCLAFSGLCDCFDGKIARTKKNRTDDEKNFGIQLDSLCDVVCFGVFPALIAYLLGMRGMIGVFILLLYCICGVIRLSFFNVLEQKRQQEDPGAEKIFHGLPITSISVLFPVAFLLQFCMPESIFILFLHIFMLAVAILFVLDIRVKKPTNRQILLLIIMAGVALLIMFLFTRYRIPPANADPMQHGSILDVIESGGAE